MISSETATVYLGLGSNMGDRCQNLAKALDYLGQRMNITARSSIYDTAPMENPEQPRFLNMVCRTQTMLQPEALLALVKGIEVKLGRLPGNPNSPRPMDIDILLYGDRVVKTPDLVIPHPKMGKRQFALLPLAEIAPGLVHPVTKLTIEEMSQKIKKSQGVIKLADCISGAV